MMPIDAHQLYLAERAQHNDARHPHAAGEVIGQLADAMAQFWSLATRPARGRRRHRGAHQRTA